MAKLGDLVVRIGADTRDLNKSLGRVQRNMRSMTGNITRMGQDMTRSITLPLLGIGAAAVKSAADLETLETSFVSLTGGAAQAADMVKQLNEFTAATPFQLEEVGNAARQLIASGTAISEVNDQLQFLGDIAATSGSSINDIAAIFAKVNAKGKVELESLNQLAERGIPIFAALAEATGLPADKLGAGRVSVEEFNKVLKSFSQEGGFAAGAMERLSQTAAGKFSTALDNLKLAAASIGEELLPSVTMLLDKITSLAQGFVSMDPIVKRLAITFGGLAASIGPVIAFLPQIANQIKGIATIISGGGIAIAVAAFAALAATFLTLRENTKTLQDRFNKAQKDANKNAADSIANARVLVIEFEKEETTLKRKKEILQELQRISPEYYGHLEDATTTVNVLTEATDKYVESIKAQAMQQAVASAQAEQLAEIANKQREVLDLQRERNKLVQQMDENMDGIVSVHERAEFAAKGFMNAFKIEDLDQVNAKIKARQQQIEDLTAELLVFRQEFGKVGQGQGEDKGIDVIATKLDTSAEAMDKLTTKTIAQTNANKELQKSTWNVGMMVDTVNVKFENFAKAVQQSFEKAAEAVLVSVGTMIGAMAAGTSAPGDFANSILSIFANLATELGQLAIGYGVAIKGIKEALTTLNPVLAVVAGVA